MKNLIWLSGLLIIFGIFLVGFFLGTWMFQPSESIFFPFLRDNSSSILAISTALLTLFTGLYVFLTSRLVSFQERIISLQYEPLVVVKLIRLLAGSNVPYLYFVVTNIGKGPAYDISFDFFKDGKRFVSSELFHKDIFDGGLDFLYPSQSVTYMLGEEVKVRNFFDSVVYVATNYRDLKGNKHRTESVISKELIEPSYGNREIMIKLADISGALNSIERTISSLVLHSKFK